MVYRYTILLAGGYANSLLNFRGDLIDAMVSQGLDVHVTAPGANKEITDNITKKGATYHDISLMRTSLNPAKDVEYVIKMAALMRRIGANIYLGYTVKPMIFGNIAAKLAGVRSRYALITGLGYLYSSQTLRARIAKDFSRPIFKYALKNIQGAIFQNPDDCWQFKSDRLINKDVKTHIINGSGVNIEKFTPQPLPDTTSFIFVGRLIREKGIYDYLQAVSTIACEYPNVRFYIAGGIDRNPSSLSMDEFQNIRKSTIVNYLGDVRDIRDALSKASVLVLPSYREGTPRSVLEAMAMGRAIITTTAPGCKETIQDGRDGFLIPPKDVTALIKAMRTMINDPTLIQTMGQLARQTATNRYDVRKVNFNILNILGVIPE